MPHLNGVSHFLVLGLLIGGLNGCSQKSPTPGTAAVANAPVTAASAADSFDKQDPCNLLDPKEVEAALGAPLAVPPYRSSNATVDPDPESNSCVYETANYRYLTLEPTYEDGAKAYAMSNMVKNLMKSGGGNSQIANNVKHNFRLDDGTEMTGEWDEASLMAMNCCIFLSLRGDQMIQMDFTATPMTLKQAATLVDDAWKRIDKPLRIDGGAGVEQASQLDKTRPKPRDVCSLLSRAEVEAILGPLGSDPQSHAQNGCSYHMPVQPDYPPQVYELNFRWKGGYSQWRSDRYVNRIGSSAMAQTVADYLNKPGPAQESHDQADSGTATAASSDPAESVSDNGMNFVVVKKDVQVSVNDRLVDKAKAQALAAAAAAKI